ncbi:MAG: hypothetical protein ACRDCG_02745 [Mycoplasmoidaceae bacterium]
MLDKIIIFFKHQIKILILIMISLITFTFFGITYFSIKTTCQVRNYYHLKNLNKNNHRLKFNLDKNLIDNVKIEAKDFLFIIPYFYNTNIAFKNYYFQLFNDKNAVDNWNKDLKNDNMNQLNLEIKKLNEYLDKYQHSSKLLTKIEAENNKLNTNQKASIIAFEYSLVFSLFSFLLLIIFIFLYFFYLKQILK